MAVDPQLLAEADAEFDAQLDAYMADFGAALERALREKEKHESLAAPPADVQEAGLPGVPAPTGPPQAGGFTGVLTDKLNRKEYYEQGQHVPGPEQQSPAPQQASSPQVSSRPATTPATAPQASPKSPREALQGNRRWHDHVEGNVGEVDDDVARARAKEDVMRALGKRMTDLVDTAKAQKFLDDWVHESKRYGSTPHEQAAAALVGKWADTSRDNDRVAQAVQERARAVFGLDDAYQHPVGKNALGRPTDDGANTVQGVLRDHGDVLDAYLKAAYAHTQEELAHAGVTEMTLYRGMVFENDAPVRELENGTKGVGVLDRMVGSKDEFLRYVDENLKPDMVAKGRTRETVLAKLRQYAQTMSLSGLSNNLRMLAPLLHPPAPRVHAYLAPTQTQPLSSYSYSASEASDFAKGARAAGLLLTEVVPREKIFSTALTGPGCLPEREVVVLGGHRPAFVTASRDAEAFDYVKDEHVHKSIDKLLAQK